MYHNINYIYFDTLNSILLVCSQQKQKGLHIVNIVDLFFLLFIKLNDLMLLILFLNKIIKIVEKDRKC